MRKNCEKPCKDLEERGPIRIDKYVILKDLTLQINPANLQGHINFTFGKYDRYLEASLVIRSK